VAHEDDPGWLFYAASLVLRLGLATSLGLALLALGWKRRPAGMASIVLLLLVYAAGFGLLMSLGAKKFDRYLLPLFPALDLLAGLGWWLAYRWAAGVRSRAGLAVVGLALALQLGPLLAVRPYPLAYYNPLLGGGPVAAQVVLIGWGEGLDQAVRWIEQQPDGARARVGISDNLREDLQALVDGTVVRRVGGADYFIDYISARQRDDIPIPGGQIERLDQPPDYTVWINGIDYARVYRLAR
jgi:hypothetical protein